jgi:hypothetical protein
MITGSIDRGRVPAAVAQCVSHQLDDGRLVFDDQNFRIVRCHPDHPCADWEVLA